MQLYLSNVALGMHKDNYDDIDDVYDNNSND